MPPRTATAWAWTRSGSTTSTTPRTAFTGETHGYYGDFASCTPWRSQCTPRTSTTGRTPRCRGRSRGREIDAAEQRPVPVRHVPAEPRPGGVPAGPVTGSTIP
ncbi:hypothetical protein QJS66_20715 [Kocuria rhizophila]|nr:hypothetical protein QJS66_20715 [Kocuria rhizophila]